MCFIKRIKDRSREGERGGRRGEGVSEKTSAHHTTPTAMI